MQIYRNCAFRLHWDSVARWKLEKHIQYLITAVHGVVVCLDDCSKSLKVKIRNEEKLNTNCVVQTSRFASWNLTFCWLFMRSVAQFSSTAAELAVCSNVRMMRFQALLERWQSPTRQRIRSCFWYSTWNGRVAAPLRCVCSAGVSHALTLQDFVVNLTVTVQPPTFIGDLNCRPSARTDGPLPLCVTI